jgi:hypothetical protein
MTDQVEPASTEAPQPPAEVRSTAGVEEPLPSFSEQISEQLGGARGLIESSIPITLFVIVNFLGDRFDLWALRTSLIIAVAAAVLTAAYRLSRKETVRHAFNGVLGVAIGAYLAWRSGDARDVYLPGILISAGYGVAMIGSVVVRRPMVGWIWSVMLDGGKKRWYDDERLRGLFGKLTVLWAAFYLSKAGVQWTLYQMNNDDLLGLSRLALGWPPYILLAAVTIWQVRRVTRVPG